MDYISDDDWTDLVSHSPVTNRATSSSNHSEIEKRRRDRMNELMRQLAALTPATFSRKLDKLSVLRLAHDHISAMCASNDKELNYDSCAKHLTFNDLLTYLRKNTEHFMTVVDTTSGKILYASNEMYKFFGADPLTRNWYEVLHPVDAVNFKKETNIECYENANANDSVCEAVSSSTGYYKQKIDWNLGLRRSFLCRLKVCNAKDSNHCEQSYENFRGFGLLRDSDKPMMVILLIRSLSSGTQEQFQIIVAPKGQVIRCGSEIPLMLKRVPQDYTGCCYYDLVHEGDLLDVAYHHKQVLCLGGSRETSYRIRAKNMHCIQVDATWTPFTNPWNLKTQFIIINHRRNSVRCDEESSSEQSVLKQLLSRKQSQRNCQKTTPEMTVLGVARLGESAAGEV